MRQLPRRAARCVGCSGVGAFCASTKIDIAAPRARGRRRRTRAGLAQWENCSMLQVTFRELLPSEELLAVARGWYESLRAAPALADKPLSCSVLISAAQSATTDTACWRVTLEISAESTCLTVFGEASQPERALTKTLAAAKFIQSRAAVQGAEGARSASNRAASPASTRGESARGGPAQGSLRAATRLSGEREPLNASPPGGPLRRHAARCAGGAHARGE